MTCSETTASEPVVDYRFTLANERTYLAWIRTAMAFLAGGVAVVHLMPDRMGQQWGTVIGIPLFALAMTISCVSLRRWRLNNAAIARSEELPRSSLVLTLAVVLSAMSLAGLAILLFAVTSDA